MRVSAVIPGAGRSLRFSRESDPSSSQDRKQFKFLGNQPLIFITLQPFFESNIVSSIALVVPHDVVRWMREKVKDRLLEKEVTVIPGGSRRQDSVWNGLKEVSGSCDVVVVHDAVRPFFKKEWIEETVELCSNFDGAIVAVRANDTLKRVKNEIISATLPRGEIWHAQTPQTFNTDVLLSAFENARTAGITCTDEAQLVELNGGRVAIVEGSFQNIKITTIEDWVVAESIWEKLNHD